MSLYPSLCDRLQTQHLSIAEIIKTLPAERLLVRPHPDKWNIHDNIAHLAKYQLVFIERISIILNEDNPAFDRYKADNDPGFPLFRTFSDADLLQSLHLQRENLRQILSGLDEAALERTAVHKKFGKLTIVQWTEFFLLHEAHHIFTIFQLANDVGLE